MTASYRLGKKLLYQLLLLVPFLMLGSCGEIQSPTGEALRIMTGAFKDAYLNEDYRISVTVAGGLSPYSYSLQDGALPVGMRLEQNVLTGLPTQKGDYSFTLIVSDANLSKTYKNYTLRVTEAPPPKLNFNLPATQMNERFMVRVDIEEARKAQSLRTMITWDAEYFRLVEGSVRKSRRDSVMFVNAEREAGQLQVDLVNLSSEGLNGKQRVFEFELEPLQRSTVALESKTEFLDINSKHSYKEQRDGNLTLEKKNQNDLTGEGNDPNNDPNNQGDNQ